MPSELNAAGKVCPYGHVLTLIAGASLEKEQWAEQLAAHICYHSTASAPPMKMAFQMCHLPLNLQIKTGATWPFQSLLTGAHRPSLPWIQGQPPHIYWIYLHIHTQKDMSCIYIGVYSRWCWEIASPKSEGKPFAFSACCKVHSGHLERHCSGVLY